MTERVVTSYTEKRVSTGGAGVHAGRAAGGGMSNGTKAIIALAAVAAIGVGAYFLYTLLSFRLKVNGSTGPISVQNDSTNTFTVTGAKGADTLELVYSTQPSNTGNSATTFVNTATTFTDGGSGSLIGTATFSGTSILTTGTSAFTFYAAAYDATTNKYSNWVQITIQP